MISVATWLKSFGFTQDPFSSTEAGGEDIYSRNFLHATFVKPDCFDDILGDPNYPKSSLIFARRGSGKSSARVMLAHYCEQGLFPDQFGDPQSGQRRVLPVIYIPPPKLLTLLSEPLALAEAHVKEILKSCIVSLVRLLCAYPEMADKARRMDRMRRVELQSYLLLSPPGLSFAELESARTVLGSELFHPEENRPPMGFAAMDGAAPERPAAPDLFDTWVTAQSGLGPLERLERLGNLIVDLGIIAIYVLVDGLDENILTADNPKLAADFLLPLVADLRLMNTVPRLALKIFAPTEMAPALLEATRKVRPDRIARVDILWDAERLVEILRQRLRECSQGAVDSLDGTSDPAIKGKIDRELARRAEGIPRHLILLSRYMIQARCEQASGDGDSLGLTQADLNRAAIRLAKDLGQEAPSADLAEPATVVSQKLDPAAPMPDAPLSTDWLRRDLPFPLAYAYLIYQRETDPDKQLREFTELVEASLAYLSLALIGFLYGKVGADTPARLQQIDLSLMRIPLGRWRAAVSGLSQLCAQVDSRAKFVRQCQRWAEQQSGFLGRVNDIRNQYAHDGTLSREECSRLLKSLEPGLQEFQAGLRFLASLHLVKVTGLVKREAQYVHRCVSYTGDVNIFPTIEITCGRALDSEALWLISEDLIVKLHPLLIARPAPDGRGEDVWLYHGVNQRNVYYKFYGAGRTLELPGPREQVRRILGV